MYKDIITSEKIVAMYILMNKKIILLNPLISPGEEVTIFTPPYLSAGAHA